jgi:hypothetical protein
MASVTCLSAVRQRPKLSKSFEFRQVACTTTSLHYGITSFISFHRITCIVLRSCQCFRIVTASMLPHTGCKLQSIIEARHKSLYSGVCIQIFMMVHRQYCHLQVTNDASCVSKLTCFSSLFHLRKTSQSQTHQTPPFKHCKAYVEKNTKEYQCLL